MDTVVSKHTALQPQRSSGRSHAILWALCIATLVIVYLHSRHPHALPFLPSLSSPLPQPPNPQPPRHSTSDQALPPHIFHHLAQYSPYYTHSPYLEPPPHCSIDQVSILQRHGARYPTKGATRVITPVLDRLKRILDGLESPCGKLGFLKTYRYELGTEDLVPLGVRE